MKSIITPGLALGLALAAGISLSADAFAKAHNQGNTADPGSNVGTETVGTSQSLGSIKGNRPADKGPSEDNPATDRADGRGASGGSGAQGSSRGQ